jgi:hypothetical protein
VTLRSAKPMINCPSAKCYPGGKCRIDRADLVLQRKYDVRAVRVKNEKAGPIGWTCAYTLIASGQHASPNGASI